jgi:hypothetical protein
MRGDFSRDTYDRVRHFSRVLQQQGRVQLDADWNEQAEILLHYVRTLAADLIGPGAGPAGNGLGLEISGTTPAEGLTIGPGRYYVDGVLCENERTVGYSEQQDYPGAPALKVTGTVVVYLDVWERHLTAVEDDRIREVALGGPDTATRTKVVWQVKVDDGTAAPFPNRTPTPVTLRREWSTWIRRWQPEHTGCLRARAKRPDAKYQGAENQLYRVEVHRGGAAGTATFKWSRDNGSVASRAQLSGVEVAIESPRRFAAGQWVELTNDGQELRGRPGPLVKVRRAEDARLTLESPVSVPPDVPAGETWPTKVRRWDHHDAGSQTLLEGAVPLIEGAAASGWIDLEDGVQVQFLPGSTDGSATHTYRAGDYWLIPARVATGDIEWPVGADGVTPASRPPRGTCHHYAPLAILHSTGAGWTVIDCRCAFSAASG